MSYIDPSKRLKVELDSLRSIDENLTKQELEVLTKELLTSQIFGLSFSAYSDGQSPAIKSILSDAQIKSRLDIIKPYTKWVRSFSCTEGNEKIPRIAKGMGLKTIAGAWIDGDMQQNKKEIESLIEIASQGYVDIVAVGNEVLLREDLSVEALIEYIKEVKRRVPNIKVAYVDAYYIFGEYPEIVDVCDVLLANCYPFWEYCPLSKSVDYMKHMYDETVKIAKGKKVIISETGWPSNGTNMGPAIPSVENALRYLIHSYQWAKEENVDIVYFSSFDEVWKIHDEGDCGAYWGLWDKDNKYKYGNLQND